MNYRWFTCLLALVLSFPFLSSAQYSLASPDDVSDASYVKAWRWESADSKSTIDVSSSSLVLFDCKLYDYDLTDHALTFTSGGDSVPYRYDPGTDLLTCEFGDSATVEYHRTIQSVLARRGTRRLPENAEFLFGRYVSWERRTINFHGNTEFDFGTGGYSTGRGAAGGAGSAALGTALVYGDVIIFSFYDSSAAEADVETRDSRGEIRSFIYADEQYSRARTEAAVYPTPYPEPVPGPPPPYPIPPMDPPYYPPYYPPYHPPVYYPPYYPPVVVGGQIAPPHAGGGKSGRDRGDTRTTGVHRGGESGGGRGTIGSPRRPSGSGGSSSGGSSGGHSGSSGGTSRGGNRR
jgi:hypothetical protein